MLAAARARDFLIFLGAIRVSGQRKVHGYQQKYSCKFNVIKRIVRLLGAIVEMGSVGLLGVHFNSVLTLSVGYQQCSV